MGQALTGGVVGASAVALAAFGWYHFSGTRQVVNTATDAYKSIENAKNKVLEATPEPREALRWIRQTAQSYAAFIPGAKPVLDAAFDDIDKISAKHGDKVDKLVSDTYDELKKVAKDGINVASATKAYSVILSKVDEIGWAQLMPGFGSSASHCAMRSVASRAVKLNSTTT